jgi:hypothetical protein
MKLKRASDQTRCERLKLQIFDANQRIKLMTAKGRAFSKRPFNFEQFGQSGPPNVPDNISIDYAITHLSSSER